ncbi:MAG: NlpC/P60 family protein [Legionella sp.]|nr:NlpC/P60 family protein [Legionella sp.]
MMTAQIHQRPAGSGAPWASRYSGIPFANVGFTPAGVHCWGLIWLVFQRECGIALNGYGAISARTIANAAATIAAHKALPPWRHVATPAHAETSEQLIGRVTAARALKAFDVVTMLNGDASSESHVGIMIDARRMLHTEADCGTVIVDLGHVTVRWRVTGFYRHEALA